MIDEKKLIEKLEILCTKCWDRTKKENNINLARKQLNICQIIGIINIQPRIGEWIPCAKQLPENEQEVEITYVYKHHLTGEPSYLTARAFYEDGTLTVGESAYDWAENEYYEYIEGTDSYIVPKGWYEDVSFAEELAPITETVIAWRPVGEPYRPTTEE